jgi:hypothetical protein
MRKARSTPSRANDPEKQAIGAVSSVAPDTARLGSVTKSSIPVTGSAPAGTRPRGVRYRLGSMGNCNQRARNAHVELRLTFVASFRCRSLTAAAGAIACNGLAAYVI